MNNKLILFFFFIIVFRLPVRSEEQSMFFHENFNDLTLWEPLYFPKIKSHSTYSIHADRDNSYLMAVSSASASGIKFVNEFNVYEYPYVTWSWKVNNIYEQGNAKLKQGDDYPIRVYIIFKYNPKKATFREKMAYSSAKLLRGEYPPHSSLNYIWANKDHEEKILKSTYTDKSAMILLQKGKKNIGLWQTETINIIEDYHNAFGKNPPVTASVAIMNDSDNTKEKAVSYVDFIKIYSGQ